jgi:hypothetical protein
MTNHANHHRGRLAAALALAVLGLAGLLVLPSSAPSQTAPAKLQLSPGGSHGEIDFPISWKRYYAYGEWTKIIADLQKKYPHLADLASIGKSRMGREQYLLTITSKASGPADKKPALWVDGAIHGNEVNGITCSLYLAWSLLTRYDYDPRIHDLVDRLTFYILPGLNVDANDSYVVFPNTANNPREPFRPWDDDGDGLYDEDQTEDVDGDGELSMMYVEDPAGELKLSPDKRRFVAVADPREEVRRFRRIGPEGYDNDGDGRINEDDLGGPDPNRNFPFDWSLANGYPYPLSEQETRNVFEFWLGHGNIFASFHYHNTGKLIMFAAPQAARAPLTPDQQRLRTEQVARQLEDLRKANRYAQLFDRVVDRDFQNDMAVQTDIVTMGARILKDYRPTPSGMVGQAQANSYFTRGAFAYLIELWGTPLDGDVNADGRVDDEEYLKWVDVELGGEGWIDPHPFRHPDLGPIWIGGTARKHMTRTPPARYIEDEALRNAQFALYCASQFPRVSFGDVVVKPVAADLFWLEVAVKNESAYPTFSDQALKLKLAVPDRLRFTGSESVNLVEVPARDTSLGEAGAAPARGAGKTTEFRLLAKDAKTFAYLVKLDGATGWAELSVESKAGGTAKKRIELKAGR